MRLEQSFSQYLDFFRIAAALIVVADHAFLPGMTGTAIKFPFGADSVIAFFILSGFVISYVADRKERDPVTFSVARLSRLWSVLIPALLIAPCFDFIGLHFDPALYEAWAPQGVSGHWLPQAGASAFFVNEIWFTSLSPQFNTPVWSIGFEFWYYVLFAVFVFCRGRFRWPILALIACGIGPKILLLMPPWLLGVALYRWRARITLPTAVGLILVLAGPSMIVLGHYVHGLDRLRALYIPLLGRDFVYSDLNEARDFLWLNLVGIALTLHLAGVFAVVRNWQPALPTLTSFIQGAAGLTYSIYLLHFPAQMMIAALLHDQPPGLPKIGVVLAGSLMISAGLGYFLEKIKSPLRQWMMQGIRNILPTIRNRDDELPSS